MCNLIEQRIREQLGNMVLSPSHDHWHLDRVLSYARDLQAQHGGDLEILTAAVLLHDLGRVDAKLHDQASADYSASLAETILRKVDFPDDKINGVLLAIYEHDKPQRVPSTVEGKILKDADFLAGFGAWGVLRIAMWAGEMASTGESHQRGDMARVLDRLKNRMPERLRGLEFEESQFTARRLSWFASLFGSALDEPASIEIKQYRGSYFVLEGISGSGKDTQARLLQERLVQSGHEVTVVSEPTDLYREYRELAKKFQEQRGVNNEVALTDPMLETYLLMADRLQQIQSIVLPALREGKIVISVRNFISTLVYQANPLLSAATIAYLHAHLPPPDMVIVYDLDPEQAAERIRKRATTEGRPLSPREKQEDLTILRERYRTVARLLPGITVINLDADRPLGDVAAMTWEKVTGVIR